VLQPAEEEEASDNGYFVEDKSRKNYQATDNAEEEEASDNGYCVEDKSRKNHQATDNARK
jgi:hypothetical protein